MWNSYVRYHPRIGYTTMPSIQWRVPAETGGYLARSNAAGFRSDFEYLPARTTGKFRAVLVGDSQTAGDGVSNANRYGDAAARLVPGLEVYNYGLSGTGPDQQHLIYLDCAQVEHDLVIIGLHIENIKRVSMRYHVFRDSQGQEVVYAKPYYTLDGGQLTLHHVPVPRSLRTLDSVPPDDVPFVSVRTPSYSRLRKLGKTLGLAGVIKRLDHRSPAPEYASGHSAEWRLLRAILEAWIAASRAPVLLFLVPMWQFVEEDHDPRAYQARFAELARHTGCHLHDPLADLRAYPLETRRSFRFKNNAHFTPAGHQALAASLAPVVQRIMAESQSPCR